jgi:hypothetical protein
MYIQSKFSTYCSTPIGYSTTHKVGQPDSIDSKEGLIESQKLLFFQIALLEFSRRISQIKYLHFESKFQSFAFVRIFFSKVTFFMYFFTFLLHDRFIVLMHGKSFTVHSTFSTISQAQTIRSR